MQHLTPEQIEQIQQALAAPPRPQPLIIQQPPPPRRPQADGGWMAAISTLAVVIVAGLMAWQLWPTDVRTQTPPATTSAAPAPLPAAGGGVPAVVEQVQETAAEVIEAVVEEVEEAGQPADVVIEAGEPTLVERVNVVEPPAQQPYDNGSSQQQYEQWTPAQQQEFHAPAAQPTAVPIEQLGERAEHASANADYVPETAVSSRGPVSCDGLGYAECMRLKRDGGRGVTGR